MLLRARSEPSEARRSIAVGFLRDQLVACERIASWLPHVLLALAALTILWTRAIGLNNSLGADEAESAIWWIDPGPRAIFSNSHYVPGNHLLFNLLTWATLQVTELQHVDSAYRFWAAVPAVAAVAGMGWWAWRRLDPWVATVFVVLAGGSALYLYYGSHRGYGFGFLAGVMTMIGAEQLFRWKPLSGSNSRGPRIRAATAMLAAGAVLGIWSLPNFATVFLVVVAILMAVKALRRRVLALIAAVGAGTLAFYAPVLPAVIANSSQRAGTQLSLPGFITRPLADLLVPNVTLLLPHLSSSGASLLAACLLVIGGATLAARSEPFLALVLLAPAFGSYLVLEIARSYVADRFESFLVLPLLLVGAVALVAIGRLIARGGRVPSAAAAVVGVILVLVALDHNEKLAQQVEGIPFENYREAAAVAQGSGIRPTIMLGAEPRFPEIEYYFGFGVLSQTASQLKARFCSAADQFVYVDLHRDIAQEPSTTCLIHRGAVHILIRQRRFPLTVWIVPASMTMSLVRRGGPARGQPRDRVQPPVRRTAVPRRRDVDIHEAVPLQRARQEVLIPGALVNVPNLAAALLLNRIDLV